MEIRDLGSEISVIFESEEWRSMEPKLNHRGVYNSSLTYRQLINVRSLSLWYGVRVEAVSQKM
jgi:hypothetical protein